MAKRQATTVRREQIAEAALTLVAERGSGALTARNVARAVGMTAPALYRHFPEGKAAILESVLDLLWGIRQRGFVQADSMSSTALEKLHQIYTVQIEIAQHYRALPALLLADTVWNALPSLRERMEKDHAAYQKRLCAIIKQGQEDGSLRTDILPEQIFVQFIGQSLTIALLYYRCSLPMDPASQAQANWKMFETAVSP